MLRATVNAQTYGFIEGMTVLNVTTPYHNKEALAPEYKITAVRAETI